MNLNSTNETIPGIPCELVVLSCPALSFFFFHFSLVDDKRRRIVDHRWIVMSMATAESWVTERRRLIRDEREVEEGQRDAIDPSVPFTDRCS